MKLTIKLVLIAGLLALSALASAAAPAASPATVRPLNVDITYPRVEGYGPADAVMSQTLRQEIDTFAEIFQRPDFSGKVGYQVELADPAHLSITVNEMHYAYRAAHPMSYLRAFTFDTKTGARLALADLFKADADYRAKLNDLMNAQIAERKIPIFSFSPFTGVKDDQEYYLTADSLVVYYQLYEFTPYVWGFLKFPIPYKDIADILKPEFLPQTI